MKLKTGQIRDFKPQDKPVKLADGHGLYLHVMPTGGKLWRYDYRFNGKRKTIALGKFPVVTLTQARAKHCDAMQQLEAGIDPMEKRTTQKAVALTDDKDSFEAVARGWLKVWTPNKAASHVNKVVRLLERDIYPYIGKMQVAQISPQDVLRVADNIVKRGAIETAHRSVNTIGQIIQYAIVQEKAKYNITKGVRIFLPKVHKGHFAAMLDKTRLGEMLTSFDNYHGGLIVKSALRLMPLLFVRPGELRNAKWEHIDFNKAQWRPPIRHKEKQIPIVPLSTQALNILKELHHHTGHGTYVFPSPRRKDKCMSENGVLVAMRELGIGADEQTGHGFRAVARTLIREDLSYHTEVIEMQLGHRVADVHGRAYNRTEFLSQRIEMMQAWADYLDKIKSDTL